MLKRLQQRMRKFENSEKGAAALEFALVGPVFFLLLGVIIETGLMMFTEYVLQTGVQDSSRLIRTGQAQMGAALDIATFKKSICNIASVVIDCTNKVTVYVRSDPNFATLKAKLPPFINVGPTSGSITQTSPCYYPGPPSQPAVVVATYDWYFTMWGMSYLGNLPNNTARRLVGFSIFLNEPYPGTSPGVACP